MIVVTGGAGFIGGNLVRALVGEGGQDVVVVDRLDDPRKVGNLAAADIADLIEPDRFLELMARRDPSLANVTAVLHQGARTSTLDDDGRAVMAANFEYSKAVFEFSQDVAAPLVYASSAAVYGTSSRFHEDGGHEAAVNVYGFSKQLFDQWVRRRFTSLDAPVVGLRYFNVYGPGEDHKDAMASVVTQFDDALSAGRSIRLFGDGCGAAAGEHRRDFVSVADVVRVVRWFLAHPSRSGIFNCGTGAARSFNEVAATIVAVRGHGDVEYVPFPDHLRSRYQAHTEADLTLLRSVGCSEPFTPIEVGISQYLSGRSGVPS